MKKQLVEGGFCQCSLRAPAMVFPLIIVDVVRAKGSARGNFLKNWPGKQTLARIHFSQTTTGATTAATHGSQEMRPGVEGQGDRTLVWGKWCSKAVRLAGGK